jgi:hypothetical protein
MRDIVAFILGNFTLTFFVIGLVASAIALWRVSAPCTFALIVEELFAYFLLFSIGFSYLYKLVVHVFFGKLAASFIEDSPFQLEVGFASLGFAAITAHNFAPGNSGIIFYSDILLPIVGFMFLWL